MLSSILILHLAQRPHGHWPGCCTAISNSESRRCQFIKPVCLFLLIFLLSAPSLCALRFALCALRLREVRCLVLVAGARAPWYMRVGCCMLTKPQTGALVNDIRSSSELRIGTPGSSSSKSRYMAHVDVEILVGVEAEVKVAWSP